MKVAVIAKEDVTIHEVNPESDDFAGNLGIEKDRRDEICDIVEKGFHTHNTLTSDISAITSNLNNKQELGFAMFIYGAHLANTEREQQNPLASLLAALGNRN